MVVAGGYDDRVAENVEHHCELTRLAEDEGLTTSNYPDLRGQVVFVRSFSNATRSALLARCRCVLYTPDREHFGIVPVEAMYARRPVVAVNSGGPTESVKHNETGFLCAATPAAFADAMHTLALDEQKAARIGQEGRVHVQAKFSLAAFTRKLDAIITDAHKRPPSSQTAWVGLIGVYVNVFVMLCVLLPLVFSKVGLELLRA